MSDPIPIEQLPVDDWADQDLLTKQDARVRLIAEINRTRSRLEQLAATGSDAKAEVALLERRLDAMESICGEYDAYLGGM
ncbi:hypothetical protein [Mycobacterium colombiense]|uniref:hypothetical protein n=1 Tax=Mycobacterium colombiense TaxID=339268 RepID=UPI000AC7279D|nr:hypothetical protein [Mycobacterium colombiense]